MSAALPLADPQFWIVTLAMVVAVGLAVRRVWRTARSAADTCAACPKAKLTAGPRRPEGKLPVLGLGVLVLAAPAAPASPQRVEREVAAMGTSLRIVVEGLDRAAGLALSEAIVESVETTERRLSTWRADSELARFNAAPPGAAVELAPATRRALGAAVECWRESGGAFDPTLAPLVEIWGLRQGGRIPSAAEVARALEALNAGALAGEVGRSAWRQPGGVRVEEGGFGKGAALDEALDAAAERAPGAAVWLDFGGQVAWTGQPGPVVLHLSDPRQRDRAVLELVVDLPRGSFASSGNVERGRLVEGQRVGHLLDPRTGRPAADFGSAGALHRSATIADCRSTALFVLGAERAVAWLAERGGQEEGILIALAGERRVAHATAALAARARRLVPELELLAIESAL